MPKELLSERQKISFGFGARLKAAREAAGLSGAELGKGAGENGKDASKASVSDWEHDRHYPKADQLRVICLKLNINVDDLIFGDIKDRMKLMQAESAIKALSEEQRAELIRMMSRTPVPDERVAEHIDPAPRHELSSGFGELPAEAPRPQGRFRRLGKRLPIFDPASKTDAKKKTGA